MRMEQLITIQLQIVLAKLKEFIEGKSATPDFYGGFNLNASYKVFLGMTFNYSFGNYLYFNPGWVIHGDGRFTPRSTTTYALIIGGQHWSGG